MNEIVRRFIMMMGIVSIGTILIFFDTTIYLTILAAFLFGITMAIGLGLLKKEDFIRLKNFKRKSVKKTKSKEKTGKKEEPIKIEKSEKIEPQKDKKPGRFKTFFSRSSKKEQKNAPADKSKKQEKSRFLGGLRAVIASFKATVGKTQDKKHSEKIDSLLNSTIDEPLAPSSRTAGNKPEPAFPDVDGDASDDLGFDDEDFGSLDSLEIEGDESSFDFDSVHLTESRTETSEGSGGLNLDDEINAILLAGNAFDDDDTFSADGSSDSLSSKPKSKRTDDQVSHPEEGLFNSEEFFVQGIEDGLDEESFINLPEGLADKQHTGTLTDSLDELDTIKNYDLLDSKDDAFLDFDAINLDELEMDGLSLDSDEIIIEEEEDINENGIFPDDYVSSQDAGKGENKDNKFSPENSGLITPGVPVAISFSGKNEYDDILNLLQSDIKTTKKLPQKSLLRDMKDVHVNAIDLEEELETVLHLMGGKPSPINNIPDRSEE